MLNIASDVPAAAGFGDVVFAISGAFDSRVPRSLPSMNLDTR